MDAVFSWLGLGVITFFVFIRIFAALIVGVS